MQKITSLLIIMLLLSGCAQFTTSSKNSAATLNQQGIAYRQQGKFVEAEQAYQQAIAADDHYANAWLNLGILYDLYRPNAAKAKHAYEQFQSLQTEPDKDVAAWIKALPKEEAP